MGGDAHGIPAHEEVRERTELSCAREGFGSSPRQVGACLASLCVGALPGADGRQPCCCRVRLLTGSCQACAGRRASGPSEESRE